MEKYEIIEMAREYVCPGKIDTFGQVGIDLVIGKRQGPYIFDTDGKRFIDLHINGGVFNLGHRHPELIKTLMSAFEDLDIGNHHFASEARALLARKLAEKTPGDLHYTVFTSSGSEAVDIAIKTARWATKRRQIVSLDKGYHGSTGISGNVGDPKNIDYFLSRGSKEEYEHVPFNDLPAMEKILSRKKAAAVIMETIPATYGFPLPQDGYLKVVRELCHKFGSLYIADEIQTGLGRTGNVWGVTTFGIIPDILVTGKGLSGGVYPISATVISKKWGGWLTENGFGHVSTFGGAEPGCHVASRVLDICSDPALLASVRKHATILGEGFADLKSRYPFLKEIMYLEYCRLLVKAGLFLPTHDTRIVAVLGRPAALYIAQKKLPDANFGHKLIHHLNDGSSLDLIEDAIREIAKIWNFNSANKPDIELAIDGQLSNWVRDSENNQRLCYIDTSTPLFCKQGVEQQNPELLLKSAPGFLRWIIRLFFLQDVMTRYYIPRLVFMDLIANLHKEQKPELIEPAIELVNAKLPHDQAPLTKTKVDKYYREDKLIWIVFLGLRRLDRFFTTRLLRKRYEFILPGKIKR